MNRFLSGWLSTAALAGTVLFAFEAQAAPPQVRFVDVDSASFGSFVGIYGAGFGADPGTVTLGGVAATTLPLWSDTLIIARIPGGAITGIVHVATSLQVELDAPEPLRIHKGSVYVVSTNGSDTGSGDEQEPFQSLHRALQVVQAGDTVLVRAGSYDEQDPIPAPLPALYLRNSISGTADLPITWRGFGAEVPVFRGTGGLAKDSAVVFVTADYLRLARLEVDGVNNSADAVSLQGTSNWAVGMKIGGFGASGIAVGGFEGAVLAGNEVFGGGTRPNLDHGIVMSGWGAIVRDNHVHDLPNGYGIFLRYQSQSASTVFANSIHDVAGGGIALARVGGGNSVHDNVLWKTGTSQGCLCAIEIGYGNSVGEVSTGDHLYFNTVVGPTTSGVVIADRGGPVGLHDNLFAGVQAGLRVEDAVSESSLSSSHNLWYGGAEEPQFKWAGPWLSLAAFQTASARETSSILADPQLVSPALGDMRLLPGSPAIDMAGGPDQPAEDFLGVNRPQGAGLDVGAFEYDGTTAPADAGTEDGSADAEASTGGSAGSGTGGTAGSATGGSAGSATGGTAGSGGASTGGAGGGEADAAAEGGEPSVAVPATAGDSGCGCAVPAGGTSTSAAMGLAGVLAALAMRKRSRRG